MENIDNKVFLTLEESMLTGLPRELPFSDAETYLRLVQVTRRRKEEMLDRGIEVDWLDAARRHIDVLDRVAAGLVDVIVQVEGPKLVSDVEAFLHDVAQSGDEFKQ